MAQSTVRPAPHPTPRRRLLAAACGLGLIAVLAACASKDSTTGTGALGSTTPTATGLASPPVGTAGPSSASPAATPTATPTTHPPTAAPVTHAYPGDYPVAILAAWAAGDNAYLTLLTSSSTAHHLLHDLHNPDQHWTFQHGDGAAGSNYSTFYNNTGDAIVIRVVNEFLSEHRWHAGSIETWDPVVYSVGAVAYTKNLVDAWINGNQPRMIRLSESALTTLLLGLATPATSYTAALTGPPSGGEVEVEVKDPTTSLDISFIVVVASLGHAHAIQGCDIGC